MGPWMWRSNLPQLRIESNLTEPVRATWGCELVTTRKDGFPNRGRIPYLSAHMDKREAVRVPVRVRARCRAHGIVIDGLVEDVSRSGLFMRAPKQIGAGSSAE